ncbi:hypothetical protein JCGZ_06282 [Jatropha curcas]|uniref:PdxS/SNZ N-terminal domain-containing protein n=1 Tax=Jatropha curcas TaxID=180498 RepID=A0A067KLY8_JATCU|nr:hypothetical protein JCGZ_06282 [Jatropha curcas]
MGPGTGIRWELGGLGDVSETVRNVRSMKKARNLTNTNEDEVLSFTKEEVSYDLEAEIERMGKLPFMQFALGGIRTPADAAFMMQLGRDAVLLISEIFGCNDQTFSTIQIHTSKFVQLFVLLSTIIIFVPRQNAAMGWLMLWRRMCLPRIRMLVHFWIGIRFSIEICTRVLSLEAVSN